MVCFFYCSFICFFVLFFVFVFFHFSLHFFSFFQIKKNLKCCANQIIFYCIFPCMSWLQFFFFIIILQQFHRKMLKLNLLNLYKLNTNYHIVSSWDIKITKDTFIRRCIWIKISFLSLNFLYEAKSWWWLLSTIGTLML